MPDAPANTALGFNGLTKRYGPKVALAEFSATIPGGQMVGVIGRSGAGKSTLLRLINRLTEPSAGTITCGQVNVTALKGRALRQWRAQAAMIFQQFNLVPRLDVLTNVLIGALGRNGTLSSLFKSFPVEERARAVLALERLGIADIAFQRADRLSGGQQQRVAIARALVQEPRILLGDEPIASLDPRNARGVMEALREINRSEGITVICNLHTLETAREYCDRLIGLAEGRLVFDGPPSKLDASGIRTIYGEDDGAPARPPAPARA